MSYVVARNGSQMGSYAPQEISEGLASGRFLSSDLGWCEGMPDWQPLGNIPALRTAATPPPLPAYAPPLPGYPAFAVRPAAKPLGDEFGMRLLLPVGRSGWAIAAGYLGLFAALILPAPIALIISIIAIRDIRKSRSQPHPKHGMGRAVFGLITGTLGTLALLGFFVNALLDHH